MITLRDAWAEADSFINRHPRSVFAGLCLVVASGWAMNTIAPDDTVANRVKYLRDSDTAGQIIVPDAIPEVSIDALPEQSSVQTITGELYSTSGMDGTTVYYIADDMGYVLPIIPMNTADLEPGTRVSIIGTVQNGYIVGEVRSE